MFLESSMPITFYVAANRVTDKKKYAYSNFNRFFCKPNDICSFTETNFVALHFSLYSLQITFLGAYSSL